MAIKDLMNEVDLVVQDIRQKDFSIIKSQGHLVPGYEDQNLSFERGQQKKAKTICTCVLYADIRNSTTLSHNHSPELMARLYTAFTKTLLLIAEHHNGVVRNIIGDRVMILFPENNCFTNALDAAVSINTAARTIDKRFPELKFECGIGIDYGEMLVIKAGIPKQEPERTNYKNLIWIGKPANIASKLTDIANKKIKSRRFKVTYYPYSLPAISLNVAALFGRILPPQKDSLFADFPRVDEMSESEFTERINWNTVLGTTYNRGKFVSFEKNESEVSDPPILFTQIVFEMLKKQTPVRDSISKNLWKIQTTTIKDYAGVIYGGNVTWSL